MKETRDLQKTSGNDKKEKANVENALKANDDWEDKQNDAVDNDKKLKTNQPVSSAQQMTSKTLQ